MPRGEILLNSYRINYKVPSPSKKKKNWKKKIEKKSGKKKKKNQFKAELTKEGISLYLSKRQE